jgi:hypothetical protein
MTTRYATIDDYKNQEVIPALTAGDGRLRDFDVDTITNLTCTYNVDTVTAADGTTVDRADTAGFESTVTTEEFWAVVEGHPNPLYALAERAADGATLAAGGAQLTARSIVDAAVDGLSEAVDGSTSRGEGSIVFADGRRMVFGLEVDEDGDIDGWTYSVYLGGSDEECFTAGSPFGEGEDALGVVMTVLAEVVEVA